MRHPRTGCLHVLRQIRVAVSRLDSLTTASGEDAKQLPTAYSDGMVQTSPKTLTEILQLP
jgi:hypothetical protein